MTLDTVFEQEFKKIVEARLGTLHSDLAHFQAVPDYNAFAFRVGMITALRDLIPDMLVETNDIISKR